MIENAVAVVGIGAIMPDADSANQFWQNILAKRYSIKEVPAGRWSADMYYHPDRTIPDKTYSKIGSWVENFEFNPFKWGIMIPPNVLSNMDDSQKWAIAASHQALVDFGYPERELPLDRVAVILGNAMAGEKHYKTNLRIHAPLFSDALAKAPAFKALSKDQQKALQEGMLDAIYQKIPPINEDTMPGELSNIIAGRVANVFNFGGPNFVADAACASSMAALQAAVEGLIFHRFDAVITGGIDRNNGAGSFVKFSKIGALSPDGSRPYADGANGFVMGEGGAVFLLKRLADAERDNDKIYAVIRGIGGSSDGKGKGITAPNPIGQQRALERAWKNAGVNPNSVGLIEGHGTSTRVGDRVETLGLETVFGNLGLKVGSVGLGSVKSNIGHLKSAAGAAGLLKVFYALHEKTLPPSANFDAPNPEINFDKMPFYVIPEAREWPKPIGEVRRAGVSSFGFGGTNFHVVVEEYIPGLLTESKTFPLHTTNASAETKKENTKEVLMSKPTQKDYDNMLIIGGDSADQLKSQLNTIVDNAQNGILPDRYSSKKYRHERLVITYADGEELLKRSEKALKGLSDDQNTAWNAYATQGIYRASGKPGKTAFLFPGQGSQYANMLRDLAEIEPVVAETYAEADRVMAPLLGKPLTDYIFADEDEESIAKAEEALKNTSITQPAVLTANVALMRLLQQKGFEPDMLIGHSLGEYAALVAAGALTFEEALVVVSARGDAMAKLEVEDNGCMAAVRAPLQDVERILAEVQGYAIIANINSPMQSVIGGNTNAIEQAVEKFKDAGFQAVKIPVSHAFHTKIVAPASVPLREMIENTNLKSPKLPIAANVTGDLYPTGRAEITEMLANHIASSVQFVKGIETLYREGARIYVEVGPKRVLNSLAVDILKDKPDVTVIATNHPRKGGIATFHEAICQLYAAGMNLEHDMPQPSELNMTQLAPPKQNGSLQDPKNKSHFQINGSVVISGAGLGLPGKNGHVFGDEQIDRILKGESFIDPMPIELRQEMLNKRVTRLQKSNAGAQMVTIDDMDQTIKLAGQAGEFNLIEEFGIPAERVNALDITTQLAIAAGIEALRDAGIPLVMRYKETSTGSFLPKRWMLPEALADETGVIFGSAFPGLDRMAEAAGEYYQHRQLLAQIEELKTLLASAPVNSNGLTEIIQKRINDIEEQLTSLDYHFDRKFIFRVLTMGHSQFAEYIGARGPNTAVNAACATTTHAISIAEDWIRAGRCRRVVIVAGDNITSGNLAEWIAPGLLASGATTTEGDLRQAALPFDRRRNGMVMGMGAAGLVVESEDAVRERGMQGICEVLSTDTANSAFHGTRLDVDHVSMIMDRVITTAENRFGIDRYEIAKQTMFMSHETYTPARGGSAAAEIHSLRNTFDKQANKILIANTKGYTGHTMGVGIEDIVALKALQTGIVPPIAHLDTNFEPDPELGDLNLSKGGAVNVEYALRLGAGFGSQISMALLRKIPTTTNRVHQPTYQKWLAAAAGYETADLEIVQRTLRIKDQGTPTIKPMSSNWKYGYGPSSWAEYPTSAETIQISEDTGASIPVQEHSVQTQPVQVDQEEIKTFLLGLVSEKTGYPQDVLDLELDLEADLGIDTVKQAELFAAVRENYRIPRREDLMLVDYNTLDKVIGFVVDSLAGMASPTAQQMPVQENIEPADPEPPQEMTTSQTAQPVQVDREEIKTFLLGLVSEKTGYPQDVLDLELDLEADLGIDTVKQAELFAAVRENYRIPRREDLMLVDYNTLDKVIGFVVDSLAGMAPPTAQQMPVQENIEPADPEPPQEMTTSQTAQPVQVDQEEIKTFLLGLVSEKTGYPQDVLDLELDLEADLGIDTVKQAELFAAVRENYGIPRREDLMLVDYNTLDKVIGFVMDSLAEISKPETNQASGKVEIKDTPIEKESPIDEKMVLKEEKLLASEPETTSQQEIHQVTEKASNPIPSETEIDNFSTEESGIIQRRVPIPMLFPRLDLSTPTGVTLNGTSRVLIVEDRGSGAEALANKLLEMQVEVLRIKTPNTEALEKHLTNWLEEGKIDGVYFLPGLEPEKPFSQLSLKEWHTLLDERVYTLYHLMRILPAETFMVSATSCGGLNGYSSILATGIGGGISGFCKALALERPNTLIKVVDFNPLADKHVVASQIIQETLYDPTVTEISYEGGQRYGIATLEKPFLGEEKYSISAGGVFLVSGGTGGITLPVVLDLAKKTSGRFYLLGRKPLPDTNDPDLLKLQQEGEEALQKTLMTRTKDNGQKLTPVEAREQAAKLARAAATLDAMKQIEAQGGKARYLTAELTNEASVEYAVNIVLQEEGRVDVLLHAAGIENSRKLERKSFEEFKTIVEVKTTGFFHLFKALQRHHTMPKTIALFSSVAGRFGNLGQTDYSAANDLLTKIASSLQRQYPAMRITAFDWGPWAEVGMASRGAIPRLMSMAGIELMPPDEAAKMVYREITRGNGHEAMFSGNLGMLVDHSDQPTLNIDAANQALRSGEPIHIMLSSVTGFDMENGVVLEVELDPEKEPFLHDHALNGTPLLPGVMGIEGFSVAAQHIASVLGAGDDYSFRVSKLENIQFLNGFKFYRNEPRHIIWKAQPLREENGLTVQVTLESKRPTRLGEGQTRLHFCGKVHLQPTQQPLQSVADIPPHWNGNYTLGEKDIYNLYFHGPSFQVLEGVQREGPHIIGKLRKDLPPITSRPINLDTTPLLIELCLQTAGIWETGVTGTMSLPQAIGKVNLYRQVTNGVPVYARVKPEKTSDGFKFNSQVIDAKGRVYLELENYRTVNLPQPIAKPLLIPLEKLIK